MNKRRLVFLIVIITIFQCKAQEEKLDFQVAFYNLENLFDTIDDKFKNDNEYLPSSQKKWDTEKYDQKINQLARSIASIGNWEGPDILGVCEVEHKSCLEDLVSKTALSSFNYGIIHQESSDRRGIDVACIYKKERFQVLDYFYHKIDLGTDQRPTRDILYVTGIVDHKDTLHYFVNHWPSRFGGVASSAPKRNLAAQTLRIKVDSILIISPQAKIIITGDFNDGTLDESIIKYLKSETKEIASEATYLFNTSYYLQKELKLGSHKYKDEWNLFDQMIVSSTLLNTNKKGLKVVEESSIIHNDKEWLKEPDLISSGEKPFRTFIGNNYNRGYSDHFAVSIKLSYR